MKQWISFLSFAGLYLFICVSCFNSPAKKINYEATMQGDSIVVKSDSQSYDTLYYSIFGGDRQRIVFRSSVSINPIDILKTNQTDVNETAYSIATTGSIQIHFSIGSQFDTTFFVPLDLSHKHRDSYANIVNGPCLKLGPKTISEAQLTGIKRWLFYKERYADAETIKKMAEASNVLTQSQYNEYYPEEGKKVPIVSSLRGIQYSINTNIQADYYYFEEAYLY